jgi:hypothetical protein
MPEMVTLGTISKSLSRINIGLTLVQTLLQAHVLKDSSFDAINEELHFPRSALTKQDVVAY